ncbi:Zn-dependent hydrolase [Paenibacillaceae bacterium]|nr:Zn-dependent hydrolase [Paenibacillaceae bacterium]
MAGEYTNELQVSEEDRLQFAEEIEQAVEWLASYGKDDQGGVTRLLYSDAWVAAQQALAGRMGAAGLQTYYDDCGNLFGRLEGDGSQRGTLLTGSHLDTVVCGGKYDGAYGILAGVIALQYLRKRFGPPARTIEVVSLCEEEGSRFPLTYWGSGNITGRFDKNNVPSVRDNDDIPLSDAMHLAGFGMNRYRSPLRKDLAGFIELHIEQGIILEREQKSVGIVEGIVGQKRFAVRLKGATNHAGTTPMRLRRDALAGACEMISWLETAAFQEAEPFVATTGQLTAVPNMSNVISGEVHFKVDIRDSDAHVLGRFSERMKLAFFEIAARRGLIADIDEWVSSQPVRMDREMNGTLASICAARGLSCRTMFSGAGHDAQMLSSICPTTMLFVPSKDGISHSPLEYSDPLHLANGAAALAEWLYFYGYKEGN